MYTDQITPPTVDHSRKRRYGNADRPIVALTTNRNPGTYRPATSSSGALDPRKPSAAATFSFCVAFSSCGWTLRRLERAIQ